MGARRKAWAEDLGDCDGCFIGHPEWCQAKGGIPDDKREYVRQQLADEIGASRRQVAYYEGESEHPPASLLIDLARALNVSTDELLGLQAGRKTSKLAVSTRLERRHVIEDSIRIVGRGKDLSDTAKVQLWKPFING
jgi:transcriptional regulator with XRE-family HTH domain